MIEEKFYISLSALLPNWENKTLHQHNTCVNVWKGEPKKVNNRSNKKYYGENGFSYTRQSGCTHIFSYSRRMIKSLFDVTIQPGECKEVKIELRIEK